MLAIPVEEKFPREDLKPRPWLHNYGYFLVRMHN